MTTDPQAFLDYVVRSLVDHPEDVTINRTVDEMGVLMTLDLHSEDMGKIIGRKGATAKAIRTLLRVVGMRGNARVNLKINEPAGSTNIRANSGDDGAVTRESSWGNSSSHVTSAAAHDVDAAIADLKGDMA